MKAIVEESKSNLIFLFLSFSEPIARILYSDLLNYGTISAASLSPDASPVMIKIFFFNL